MFKTSFTKTSHILKNCFYGNKIINHLKCCTTSSNEYQEKNRQNLVIDLNFEDLMTTEECRRLASDLYQIYSINKSVAKEKQFIVNLCNQFPKNSLVFEYLSHYLPEFKSLDNFKIQSKSYLDLFDRKRLLYLSPDAKQVIEFNSKDIYIFGGIVEKKMFKRESTPITYSKAKSEGLRTGRFPIDNIISSQMKRGIVLFLPQVFQFMIDINSGHKWETSARSIVPFWKLKPLVVETSNSSETYNRFFKSYRCSLY